MIAKKPTLFERQQAFVQTLNVIADTVEDIYDGDPRITAAMITAAATLVVGADITQPGYNPSMHSERDEA